MLYNKNENRKINEKKVLHKVRKNWVVVSVAILGLIGATGVTKNGVHASSLSTNHQNHSTLNTSPNQNSKVHTLLNQSAGQRTLKLGSANHQTTNQHPLNQDQITKQTDVLRNRILAQVNQKSQTPQRQVNHADSNVSQPAVNHAADYYGRSASPSTSNVSVTASQVSHAASSAQQHEQLMQVARQQWHQLDQKTPAAKKNTNTKPMTLDTFDSEANDVNNFYNAMNNSLGSFSNYMNQMKSASNAANAEINRYSWIHPRTINFNVNDASYGSMSSYVFSDNSDAASDSQSIINQEMSQVANNSLITNSVTADFASQSASQLVDQVFTDSDAQDNASKLNSIYSHISALADQDNGILGSIANVVTSASDQAISVSNDFSSVASQANSAGSAMASNSSVNYAIANVSTASQLDNALHNRNVYQINLVGNITLAGFHGSTGNEDFMDVYSRTTTINGLNNNGSWYTVDLGSYNYDFYNTTNPESYHIELTMKNLHMYGASYWGPFTVNNNSGIQGIVRYDNISYVGSQLGYNSANTSGIFEGKINVLVGAAYSPTGKYTSYQYAVPDNLSPYPFKGDAQQAISNKGVTLSKNYLSSGPYKGASVKGYHGYDGGIDNTVPDIYMPWTYDARLTNGSNTHILSDYKNSGNAINEVWQNGINMVGDQEILQISQNQTAIFKSNCDFQGFTTDGDCIAIGGGGNVRLDQGAKVHLVPRGINGEGTSNSGGSTGNNVLPSGIDINGNGNVTLNPGSTLKITPMVDTDIYNTTSKNGAFTTQAYAPAAINITSSGKLQVNNGASFLVDYPDLWKFDHFQHDGTTGYSLPDNQIENSTAGRNPIAVVSMQGNSSITAEPYSHLIVNGGEPTDAVDDTDVIKNAQKDKDSPITAPYDYRYGSLVSYGLNKASKAVDAETESDVELSVGGSQPIMLFMAGPGTVISVIDPKQFSLDFNHNRSPFSQLAYSGVGIQGSAVTAYDQNFNSSDQNAQQNSYFGQYSKVTFPGGQSSLESSAMIQQLMKRIYGVTNVGGPLPVTDGVSSFTNVTGNMQYVGKNNGNYTKNSLNNNYTKAAWGSGDYVSQDGVEPYIDSKIAAAMSGTQPPQSQSNIEFVINNVNSKIEDKTPVATALALLPEGISNLADLSNRNLVSTFNNSIDIENGIVQSAIAGLYNNSLTKALGSSAVIPPYNAGRAYDPSKERPMVYDGTTYPILNNGFDLQHGFAFKEVPHTNVEGVQVDKKTNVISGYAIPGSYIRLNYGNDPIKDGVYQPDSAGTQVLDPNPQNHFDDTKPLNGQPAYDPSDAYMQSKGHYYIAIANNSGYWSYKLPSGVDTSDTANPPLVVTAHTESVLSPNAARWVAKYNKGIQKIDSLGDHPDNSNQFDQDQNNFPQNTYPDEANNGEPSGKQDDPTYTDDDDDVTVDSNGNIHPIFDKGLDQDDDYNAGNYFWAGRLKGVYDLENLVTDNSVYNMPFPFIVGYETAKAENMDPKTMRGDIIAIINYVRGIKKHVETDYLPPIKRDESSADTSMSDINETISNLNGLLAPMRTTDPYLNLQPLSGSFVSPSSTDQSYDSQISNEYNSVSGIDTQLSSMIDTLDGYELDINGDSRKYDYYRSLARSYASNAMDQERSLNVHIASLYGDDGSSTVDSAYSVSSAANSVDTKASGDNNAASSYSNAMWSDYSYIRASASDNEAADFSSVAQSYTNSAQSDEGDVYRDSTEVSHRDRQLSVANGIFEQDEAQINEITNSLEDYVPLLSSLNALGSNSVGSQLAAEYSNDYSAANSALNFLNDLAADADTDEVSDNRNSGTANQDSSSATWASNNLSGDSQKLAMEAKTVSSDDSMQNNLVKHANFDQAQFINGQAYQSQSSDANTDSKASYDVSLASSAWVQIHNLHDKIAHGEGMVEEEMPMFNTDIQNYAHLVNSASANHENSASQTPASDSHSGAGSSSASAANDRYQGTFTVTVQDEDAQGNHTSRDIETISVDKRTGTQITLDPQQYQPSGFHSDPRNHPSIITVTRQGVMPHNVTFYYRIDHDNDSNGVQQASQTPASSSSSDSATFVDASQSSVPSANSASSDSSSDNSGVQGAPIWIDGDQEPSQMSANWENDLAPIRPSSSNESSSASAVSAAATSAVVSASSSVSSSSSSSSSSRTIQQIASSVAVRDSRSASASASVAAAVHAQSASAASSRSERSSASSPSSSAVSHVRQSSQSVQSSSAVSQSTSSSSTSSSSSASDSSAASQSRPQRNSLTMIRHQFLKRYEDRALKIPDTSRTPGAQVADRYIAGINDARKHVAYQAKDRAYHTGYHAFRRARIKSMTRDPQQASHHWSLSAALLLVLSTILSGLVAADHRCY